MPDPSITVVLPTFRRPDALAIALEALRPQIEGRPDRELIVVNDGNDDAAYRAVVQPYAGIVTYVPLPRNLGQSGARNEGGRRGRGEWLVFTDDDCAPPPWWLDWLAALLIEAPDAEVVGGTSRNSPGVGIVSRFLMASNYKAKPEIFGGEPTLLVSCNFAVTRARFLAVGGFDVALRSGEDREITYRLRRAGARILVDPSWWVWHDQGSSLRGHLSRYHHYGYWRPFATRNEAAFLEPAYAPRSLSAWVRRAAYHARLQRGIWRWHPKRKKLFLLLAFATEMAREIGYARGLWDFRDPAARRRILGS